MDFDWLALFSVSVATTLMVSPGRSSSISGGRGSSSSGLVTVRADQGRLDHNSSGGADQLVGPVPVHEAARPPCRLRSHC